MNNIEEKIKNAVESGRPVFIWGTRSWGCTLGVWFDENQLLFQGYVDNNKKKHGETIWGNHKCISPEEIPEGSLVIITATDTKINRDIEKQVVQTCRGVECIANCIEELSRLAEPLDDEKVIRAIYEGHMRCKPDLEHPKNLNEKLNWLKLHDRKPLYTRMVDKLEAKEMVAEKLGREFVIPTYGVWDSFDEIDFDSLPRQFVLKCTHDSGSAVVIEDKNNMDREAVKKKLEACLKLNFFCQAREWPYKNVKRRIIAEKYIDTLGKKDSIEYKITCFNGKADFITICTGIAHDAYEKRTNDSYDLDFHHMPWYASYKNSTKKLEQPKQWQDLIAFAELFAKDIPYLRVDCYLIDDRIVFGEFTFYTWAGWIDFTPEEWNGILGERCSLENLK